MPQASRDETHDHVPIPRRARVVVVGAGFAGGSLIKNLPSALRRPGETLLVDRSDTYAFAPLIHEVAVGRIHPGSVTSPIAPLCEGRCGYLQANVQGLELGERLIHTDRGPVAYEYLILAGGSNAASPPDHMRDRFRPFHTLDDALRLRHSLNGAWAEATAPGPSDPDSLTVAIVGGGATGVELAAELSSLFAYLQKRSPRRPEVRPRVILLEATNRLLGWLDPYYHDVALDELSRLGVEVRLNSPVEGSSEVGPRVGDEDLAAGICVWTTGIRVTDMVRDLPGDHDGSGRARVTSHLTLPDHPEVYILGDAAAYEHPRRGLLPPTASVAVQQGPWTARDLARRLNGAPIEARPAFRLFDRGYAVSLGPESAVADPVGVKLRGMPAQVLYRGVLLFFQRSRRDRTLTAADWAMERTIGRVGFDSVLPSAATTA